MNVMLLAVAPLPAVSPSVALLSFLRKLVDIMLCCDRIVLGVGSPLKWWLLLVSNACLAASGEELVKHWLARRLKN